MPLHQADWHSAGGGLCLRAVQPEGRSTFSTAAGHMHSRCCHTNDFDARLPAQSRVYASLVRHADRRHPARAPCLRDTAEKPQVMQVASSCLQVPHHPEEPAAGRLQGLCNSFRIPVRLHHVRQLHRGDRILGLLQRRHADAGGVSLHRCRHLADGAMGHPEAQAAAQGAVLSRCRQGLVMHTALLQCHCCAARVR